MISNRLTIIVNIFFSIALMMVASIYNLTQFKNIAISWAILGYNIGRFYGITLLNAQIQFQCYKSERS